jgi:hypothetical protein
MPDLLLTRNYSQKWWCLPVIPAIPEAEEGGQPGYMVRPCLKTTILEGGVMGERKGERDAIVLLKHSFIQLLGVLGGLVKHECCCALI